MLEQIRYGVFLRPDPATCAAVTQITGQLRAQYGLISAGAFPPHVTLAGSLPLAAPESTLIEALTRALENLPAFPVSNAGIRRLFDTTLAFDVADHQGRANPDLISLAERIDQAVRPLLEPEPTGLAPDLYGVDRWHPHLSLASHEMVDRDDLVEEVEAYVRGLPFTAPTRFGAEFVGLYRFFHPNWTGAWWRDLRWEHVGSWTLS
jgi:hypothetical protein